MYLDFAIVGLDIRWTAIIVGFAVLDLLFRAWIHQEVDSMAADVIIFSNVTLWYDIYLKASESTLLSVHILTVTKLLLLLVLMVIFSMYHGKYLLNLNKNHVAEEFKHLRKAAPSNSNIEDVVEKIEAFALENTHVNISKDYLGFRGNPHKERSRRYLINIISALQLPTTPDMFLLEWKTRRNHALICLAFGLLAVLLSSLSKIGSWSIQ
jgi:hypothetical protein